MAHLTEVDFFHKKIWQIDLSTPASGGQPVFITDDDGNINPVGGYDNIPSQLLADRTRNLHNRLLTIENQLLNNRLTAIENNGVGELVQMTYYPENLLSLTDYAFSGVLWMRGQTLLRSTYTRLFLKIQHQLSPDSLFGIGDGVSTFTCADLRSDFTRSWDGARGVDADRVWGSFQADEFKTHAHNAPTALVDDPTGGIYEVPAANTHRFNAYDYVGAAPVSETGGKETRPRNRAVLFCVRY